MSSVSVVYVRMMCARHSQRPDQTHSSIHEFVSCRRGQLICRADFAINIIIYNVGRTDSGNIPTRRPVLVGVPRRRGGRILQFTGPAIVVQYDKIRVSQAA